MKQTEQSAGQRCDVRTKRSGNGPGQMHIRAFLPADIFGRGQAEIRRSVTSDGGRNESCSTKVSWWPWQRRLRQGLSLKSSSVTRSQRRQLGCLRSKKRLRILPEASRPFNT